MSVTLLQVQDAIAALSVPGLRRIYTSANAPHECFERLCPCLIPHPDSPLVDSASARLTLARSPYGSGWQRPRTLAYVCLTAEVGTVSRAGAHGQRVSEIWDALENALCDFSMDGLHAVGPVQLAGRYPVYDLAGKPFFGFDVKLSILTSY